MFVISWVVSVTGSAVLVLASSESSGGTADGRAGLSKALNPKLLSMADDGLPCV